MSKITIDRNINRIKSIINALDVKQRIKLIEDLEKNTWQHRFRELLNKIDKNVEKYPVNEKEIINTVEKVRQDIYEKHHH